MSRYAQEHPDEPEFPVDEVLDREQERAINRRLIAQAEADEKRNGIDDRSDSERRANEDLHRAEIESGSEWGDGGND